MQSNLSNSQSSTIQENKRRKIRESLTSILFKFKSQHHIDPKDLNKCSKLLKSKVILDTEKLNLLRKMAKRGLEVTEDGSVDFVVHEPEDDPVENIANEDEVIEKDVNNGDSEDDDEDFYQEPRLKRKDKRRAAKATDLKGKKSNKNARKTKGVKNSAVSTPPTRKKVKKSLRKDATGQFSSEIDSSPVIPKQVSFESSAVRRMPSPLSDEQKAWKEEMRKTYEEIFIKKFTSVNEEKEKYRNNVFIILIITFLLYS